MDFDVLVIGAGPAGTQCARELAARGISVAVLEQGPAEDLAYVPCLMGPKLEAKFGRYPDDIIDGSCTCYRIIASKAFADIPAAAAGAPHLGRFANKNKIIAFDRAQAIEAGATFHFDCPVTSIKILADRVEVTTSNAAQSQFSGKASVLASGIRSGPIHLQRQLGLPVPKTTQVVWRSYRLPPQSPTRQGNEMAIVWDRKISTHAYVMYYNTPAGFFIGLLDYGRPVDEMADTLRELCARHKVISPLLEGAEYTPLYGEKDAQDFPREIISPTVRDRLLVLGDAAGFVNTFVYEGFYQAKISGRCAAEAINTAREQGRFDAKVLAGYEKRWVTELDEANLRPGRASAYILYHTGKLDTVGNALVQALKREQEAGGTKIQTLFLQNMIAPAYSRANDIVWTKAVVAEMSFADKAVMLPRFLKAAFVK